MSDSKSNAWVRSSLGPLTDAEVEGLRLAERAALLRSLIEHQMIRQAQTEEEAVLQERLLRPLAEVEAELLRFGERAGLLHSLVDHRMVRQARTEEEAALWDRLRGFFPENEVLSPEALQDACSFPVLLPTWLPAGSVLTTSRIHQDQYLCGFTHDHGGHSSVNGFGRGSSLHAGGSPAGPPLEGRRRPTYLVVHQLPRSSVPLIWIRVDADDTVVIILTREIDEEVALQIADSLEPVTGMSFTR